MTRAKGSVVAAAVALALALAGCAADPELQQLDATHVGDGVRQESVDAIAERIPALAEAEAVTYYGGYLGSVAENRGSDIGPSDLWIHAVVDLAPGGAQAMLDSAGDASLAQAPPEVVPPLSSVLPQGELWVSPTVDAKHSANGWWSTVYVSSTTDQLVLIASTM